MFKIFLSIAFFINIFSEGVLSDVCPDVIPLINLDREEVIGRWYVIKRYPYPLQNNQECIYADLKTSTTGSLDMNVTGYLTETPDIYGDLEDAWFQSFYTEVLPIDPNNLSTVKFQINDIKLLNRDKETLNLNDEDSAKLQLLLSDMTLSYKFIDVDYEKYLMTYYCDEEGTKFVPPGTEFAFILSRNKGLDQEYLQKLESELSEFGSSTDKFIEVTQDCEDVTQFI